jgi:hypothetical protein
MARVTLPAVGLAALMTSVAIPAVASAQSVAGELENRAPSSNFSRDRNVGVRERPHPEFEAQGVRLGAFMAYPRLEVAVERDDNIYATNTGEVDDTIWRVKPDISIESTWSRHRLALFAGASVNRYTDHDDENTTDWTVGGDLRLDFAGRTTVQGHVEHSDLTEPRTSSQTAAGLGPAAAEPVTYSMDDVSIGVAKEFNRLKLGAGVDFRKFDYDDVRASSPPFPPGSKIEQDDRDRTIRSVTGRADYAVSPDTALFVEVVGNNRDYDQASLVGIPGPPFIVAAERDSEGYTVLAGANFDLSNLVRGEIGVGYLSQNYDNNVFGDVDGFGFRGKVEWFPTSLTTVTFAGSRTVEDSGVAGAAAFLFTDFSAQVDHELLRNVILTGQFSTTRSEYEGIDREDQRWLASVSATWLVNRRVGVNFGVSHLSQQSDGALAGVEFEDNKVGAALILQF